MAQERKDLEKSDPQDFADHSPKEMLGDGETSARNGIEARAAETDSADNDVSIETENIKGQIEDTRLQMGETIDAIQDKLSFSNLSEQVSDHVHNAVETAKEAVYDATIGKAADIMKNFTGDISNSTMMKTAKNNPVPFILIGAGLGFLAYKGFAGTLMPREERRDMSKYRYPQSKSQTAPVDSQRGTLGQVSDQISSKAEQTVDKVSTAFDNAYAGAGAVMDRASESMDNMRSSAVDTYKSYLSDNPLALGAAALGLGAAVGMAIPASAYEGQLLGQTRDDLFNKAQDTATGLFDRTKEAIADAGSSIGMQKGSAKEH